MTQNANEKEVTHSMASLPSIPERAGATIDYSGKSSASGARSSRQNPYLTAIPADVPSQIVDEKVIRFVEESPYSKMPTTGGQVNQN